MYISDTFLMFIMALPIALLCVKEYSRLQYENDMFIRFIQVESVVKGMQEDIKYLTEELEKEKLKIRKLSQRCKGEHVTGRSEIFFDAALAKSIELKLNQTLVFDEIWVNSGSSYDNKTGKFTVPVSGVYSFSLTAVAQPNSRIHLHIMKNNVKILGGVMSGSKHHNGTDSGSAMVIRKLQKGDFITVKGKADKISKVYGSGWTYFTGILMETF